MVPPEHWPQAPPGGLLVPDVENAVEKLIITLDNPTRSRMTLGELKRRLERLGFTDDSHVEIYTDNGTFLVDLS